MYVANLRQIIPLMFAMDHYHYSRLLSIHVNDLKQLHTQCPSAYAELMSGHFVTKKFSHKFSSLLHDQIHEQLNTMVKGDRGIIGITENDQASRRWMVAGPETDRMLNNYEEKYTQKRQKHDRHHEDPMNRFQAYRKHSKLT